MFRPFGWGVGLCPTKTALYILDILTLIDTTLKTSNLQHATRHAVRNCKTLEINKVSH